MKSPFFVQEYFPEFLVLVDFFYDAKKFKIVVTILAKSSKKLFSILPCKREQQDRSSCYSITNTLQDKKKINFRLSVTLKKIN